MNTIPKHHLVLLLWFLYLPGAYAQKEANMWYFGRNAGITFNTDPPSVLTDSKMSTSEGCSSIANPDGELLFYTDGQCVWNKLHQKMSNGTGLNGDASSTHSSLIVKKPGTDSVFYVLTADDWPDVSNQNLGVSYSVVDLRRNNGLGDVTEKNVLLVNKSAEKIAATIHRNGTDIWIAIPEAGTNMIHFFLLKDDGIHPDHTDQQFYQSTSWNWGQIKFSPNSKLIALTQPAGPTGSFDTRVVVGDFNNLTGTISNTREISGSQSIYGIEFSPSSRYIYFSTWLGSAQKRGIFQMDVSAPSNPFLINCTKIALIGNGQLQLAPNGKIYIPCDSALAVINAPDSAGGRCNFQLNTIGLQTGKAMYGLPTFYSNYVNRNMIQIEQPCAYDPAHIYAGKDTLGADSAHWFVDNTKVHQRFFSFYHRFSTTGYVTIKLVVFKAQFADTFERDYLIKPATIIPSNIPDVSLCPGDSATLNAYKEQGITYRWNTGSTDSVVRVNTPGMYTVVLEKNGCRYKDTAEVTLSPALHANLPRDTFFCKAGSVNITVEEPYASCLWSTGDTTHTLSINKAGRYSVIVFRNQCRFYDSTTIAQAEQPEVHLGADTLVCGNIPFMLDVTFPYAQYRWSNLSTAPIINANAEGTYIVEVYNSCGSASDTIEITTKECSCPFLIPNVFTPNNDRLNDLFLPRFSCPVFTYRLEVYNRWGALVFASNDPVKGWDGKTEQNHCAPDSYFWLIAYTLAAPFGNGKTQYEKGIVTLLR